jgi:hypothetical protein
MVHVMSYRNSKSFVNISCWDSGKQEQIPILFSDSKDYGKKT